MPDTSSRSLFEEPDELSLPEPAADPNAPLAHRMRPETFDQFVGQEHLVGPGRFLRRAIENSDQLPSMILWGPPGSGKTTLARLLAGQGQAVFVPLSAVFSGVKDLREAITEARRRRARGKQTVLFIDEIHRFNKAQQDALLPAVEDGAIALIGATTENPSFEINNALLSRCRVLTLQPLDEQSVAGLLKRSLEDPIRGLADQKPVLDDAVIQELARACGGDARVALSALEAAVNLSPPDSEGRRQVSRATILESLGRSRFSYDRQGEDHFNLVSALIKSVRNSDADASLYWLARLIEGGADPMFLARRLCILASEDIGLADPNALQQAAAAASVTHLIGLPEALYPLTQATIYLAKAPKSNAVKRAYQAAAADAQATAAEPVPLNLRNAVTPLLKSIGYGQGYRYAHDDPEARTHMDCLPQKLAGRRYLEREGPDGNS